MASTIHDEMMMRRCFHLASLGSYHVKTNPQVGSVITRNERIIGEGYHKKYGGAHAEIEALRSVALEDRHLIKGAHIYVSLEPCFHEGKTPPCVDAIIDSGIKSVTISVKDPNTKTAGKSIAKLREHGIEVKDGILADQGKSQIEKFFVNQQLGIPYVILKWAQSKERNIGNGKEPIWLSNEQSKLMVHRWREEIDAIMVGTNTVLIDNPQLSNRRPQGRSPIRVVLDRHGRIQSEAYLLSDDQETIIITTKEKYEYKGLNKRLILLKEDDWKLKTMLELLYSKGISNVLVEGGASLHKSLIREGLWHEARIIETQTSLPSGIKAPFLSGRISDSFALNHDKVLKINNLNIPTQLI